MSERNYIRAHLRMEVMIILHYRELTAEEYSAIEKTTSGGEDKEGKLSLRSFSLQPFIEDMEKEEGTGKVDPFIINALIDINLKLNLVLSMLSGEGKTDVFTQKPTEVSLSEGGIGFTTSEKVQEGKLLELKMLLPVFPIALIEVWGKVVRATPLPEGGYRIGVQYINIKEEDQNIIVHYIFKKQRESLRTQKDRKEKSVNETP